MGNGCSGSVKHTALAGSSTAVPQRRVAFSMQTCGLGSHHQGAVSHRGPHVPAAQQIARLGRGRPCSRQLYFRRTAPTTIRAAEEAMQPAPPQHSADTRQYTGSDGRPKATFEQAFRVGHGGYGQEMPWQLSWQRNERTLKFTDAINEHMVKGFAAKELQVSEDEMQHRLQHLSLLLPDLAAKISVMKPKAVAYFAADTNRLALALVELKRLFPTADVASMVVRQPALLLERSPQELAAAAKQLRELLPRFDIDWLLERHPQIVLDVDTFAETLAEAERMLPGQDIMRTLAQNPSMIFAFERRGSMIPYDS